MTYHKLLNAYSYHELFFWLKLTPLYDQQLNNEKITGLDTLHALKAINKLQNKTFFIEFQNFFQGCTLLYKLHMSNSVCMSSAFDSFLFPCQMNGIDEM